MCPHWPGQCPLLTVPISTWIQHQGINPECPSAVGLWAPILCCLCPICTQGEWSSPHSIPALLCFVLCHPGLKAVLHAPLFISIPLFSFCLQFLFRESSHLVHGPREERGPLLSITCFSPPLPPSFSVQIFSSNALPFPANQYTNRP